MRKLQRRTEVFEKGHANRYRFLLPLVECFPPTTKLVGELNVPRHWSTIALEEYSVKTIVVGGVAVTSTRQCRWRRCRGTVQLLCGHCSGCRRDDLCVR